MIEIENEDEFATDSDVSDDILQMQAQLQMTIKLQRQKKYAY